jgi:hypothetical protein
MFGACDIEGKGDDFSIERLELVNILSIPDIRFAPHSTSNGSQMEVSGISFGRCGVLMVTTSMALAPTAADEM